MELSPTLLEVPAYSGTVHPPRPSLQYLPYECLEKIVGYLGPMARVEGISRVSRKFRELALASVPEGRCQILICPHTLGVASWRTISRTLLRSHKRAIVDLAVALRVKRVLVMNYGTCWWGPRSVYIGIGNEN